ncbi:MAG TPA: hypothetical protein PLQ87_13690 [Phycisphaerae bacterium]|nr:hypothetical protein [Phycisphaerae bacterium]
MNERMDYVVRPRPPSPDAQRCEALAHKIVRQMNGLPAHPVPKGVWSGG